MSAHRQSVGLQDFTIGINNVSFGCFGAVFRLDDDLILETRLFVNFNTIGDVFNEILIFDATGDFVDDDRVEGVPFADYVTFDNVVVSVVVEFRTVWDVGRGARNVSGDNPQPSPLLAPLRTDTYLLAKHP